MKIIKTDKHNMECISDILVCENITEYYGKSIIYYLNITYSGDFYELVENDYELFVFEP